MATTILELTHLLSLISYTQKSLALLFLCIGFAGCGSSDKSSIQISDNDETIVLKTANYNLEISRAGFRYRFLNPHGSIIADHHAQSGLRLSAPNSRELHDVVSTTLIGRQGNLLSMEVTTLNGDKASVQVEALGHHVRFRVIPASVESSAEGSRFIIDFRTAGIDPVFGMGDYGSHSDWFNDVDAPCGSNVNARDTANLTGLVRDEVINQGSCRRFVSNFAVFPSRGFAQVLFHRGPKRIGFTEAENRIGAADVDRVDTMYYFIGDMETIYREYRQVRQAEGYRDVRPRFTLFDVGWEAYGALGWDTFQYSVMDNIQTYLERGFPLQWGVVGSGFWPGDRRSRFEGTTVSFGMWDDQPSPRNDGLPNPRYPDPDALKALFRDNGMKLLLGLRNHFKDHHGEAYNEQNDGPWPREAYEREYLLRQSDGSLLRSVINQFPREPIFFIDSFNEEAMAWFLDGVRLWEADGFKEDAMIYDRMYHDDMWNPFNEALADEGYIVMVRNAAYSVPGDLLRINDSYAGTGEHYHADPHRIPLNLLNNAASGGANGYPDIIGGTPTTSPTTEQFQRYYMRNAMFAAVCAGMSFGRGPWLLEDPEIEEIALKAALWHHAYAPYIYSAAIDSYETGFPHTMTPLHIAFADDPATYDLISREKQQYQWMLGPSMLATPLFGNDFATAESRDVYLPAGTWIDYETGERFTGPTTLPGFHMPGDRIPVFIGGKGILVRRASTADTDLEAHLYPVSDSSVEHRHTHPDGRTTSIISRGEHTASAGADIVVKNTTTNRTVAHQHDTTTGAISFKLIPGNDYAVSAKRQSN